MSFRKHSLLKSSRRKRWWWCIYRGDIKVINIIISLENVSVLPWITVNTICVLIWSERQASPFTTDDYPSTSTPGNDWLVFWDHFIWNITVFKLRNPAQSSVVPKLLRDTERRGQHRKAQAAILIFTAQSGACDHGKEPETPTLSPLSLLFS